MAELAHTGADGTDLLQNVSAFLLLCSWVETVPGYIFQTLKQILGVTSPPTHYTLICLFLACYSHNSSTQFTRHFRRGTCGLFFLGNMCNPVLFPVSDFLLEHRWISCYTTHAIYIVCQNDLQVNIQNLVTTLNYIQWWGYSFGVTFCGYYSRTAHTWSYSTRQGRVYGWERFIWDNKVFINLIWFWKKIFVPYMIRKHYW